MKKKIKWIWVLGLTQFNHFEGNLLKTGLHWKVKFSILKCIVWKRNYIQSEILQYHNVTLEVYTDEYKSLHPPKFCRLQKEKKYTPFNKLSITMNLKMLYRCVLQQNNNSQYMIKSTFYQPHSRSELKQILITKQRFAMRSGSILSLTTFVMSY